MNFINISPNKQLLLAQLQWIIYDSEKSITAGFIKGRIKNI